MKILMVLYGLTFGLFNMSAPGSKESGQPQVRYVALGDSYTICEGASTAESWPVILTGHLCQAGINTQLAANPSRTGWTSQNLIDRELPVFDRSGATFVTLCIGVNDWVQGVSSEAFRKNLIVILDHVQAGLPGKSKIVLLTIPDFSVTPEGKHYTGGRDATKGIAAFNAIIQAEAQKRQLKTIDLFGLSAAMKTDKSLVAADGLHPSAKEYALWEAKIFPVVRELLLEK